MNTNFETEYANKIWDIADLVRNIIPPNEYSKLILPFSLLVRLEGALQPTRKDVVEAFKKYGVDEDLEKVEEKPSDGGPSYNYYTDYSQLAFCNVTAFTLKDIGETKTYDNIKEYIEGFSWNAREIFYRFDFLNTCKRLDDANILYKVCGKFSALDLSPATVSDRAMSNIYEHLIQKFGESISEGAEDFMTPKDVVDLTIKMLFVNEDNIINSDNGTIKSIYDPTAGTCGFITDGLDYITEFQQAKHITDGTIFTPYGQECEASSWAIGKANLLIRNLSNDSLDEFESTKDLSKFIAYGNTLTDDKFEDILFDYIVSNPPYGKKWEAEKEDVLAEAKLGWAGRFGAGLPSISDGSMLFLQHVIHKMKPATEGGARAGIVLSASPLFNGDAGSGPSNIRRWMFENDYIECIVKLPAGIFYRTGINTYLWILSTKKTENRKHMIQLIDASLMKAPISKNQGKKNQNIKDIDGIVKLYADGITNEHSVIVPDTDFMYRQITTQQPLRIKYIINEENILKLKNDADFNKLRDENKRTFETTLVMDAKDTTELTKEYAWGEEFIKNVRKHMNKPVPSETTIRKLLTTYFGDKKEDYPIALDKKGNPVPDPDKKDTENVPWNMDIDTYMAQEVLPYAKDTYVDETVRDEKNPLADSKIGKVGTEISFNKYFYLSQGKRNLKDVLKEINELQSELTDLMRGIGDE